MTLHWRWTWRRRRGRRRRTFYAQVYLRSSGKNLLGGSKLRAHFSKRLAAAASKFILLLASGKKNTKRACIASWEGLTNPIRASNPLPTYFSVKLTPHTHTRGDPPHPPHTHKQGDWFHFICTRGLCLACSGLIKCCSPARPPGQ